MEDIELKRNDENYLNALGATRIPDPTTAGDFCRRFGSVADIMSLQRAIDESRLTVWARQPETFFEQATVDMDGHLVETTGECKEGMDIAYDGTWGYHPLLLSLAETGEPLRIVNRSGNRPSEDGAAEHCDTAIVLLRQAGFRRILLRGDTAFSQTQHLDRWDAADVTFQFGYGAFANLKNKAETLAESDWTLLERGKPDRTTFQRPAGVPGTGGQPAVELGLYADGVVGLDAESVERLVAAGDGPLAGKTPGKDNGVCCGWNSARS